MWANCWKMADEKELEFAAKWHSADCIPHRPKRSAKTHARTHIHTQKHAHTQTHTHTPTKHTNTHGHKRMHTHTRATVSVHLLSLYLSFLFLSFFLSFILSLSLSLFFALYVCVSFPPSAFLSPLLFLPLRFLLYLFLSYFVSMPQRSVCLPVCVSWLVLLSFCVSTHPSARPSVCISDWVSCY